MDVVNARVPKLSGGTMERQLARLEQKYAMGSQEFLTAYNAGSLSENADYVNWAGLLTTVNKPAPRRRTTA